MIVGEDAGLEAIGRAVNGIDKFGAAGEGAGGKHRAEGLEPEEIGLLRNVSQQRRGDMALSRVPP